jgi:hypothetical protein
VKSREKQGFMHLADFSSSANHSIKSMGYTTLKAIARHTLVLRVSLVRLLCGCAQQHDPSRKNFGKDSLQRYQNYRRQFAWRIQASVKPEGSPAPSPFGAGIVLSGGLLC